jgi:uncharacterized protein YciI
MPFLIETFDKPESHHLRKQMSEAHLDFLDAHKQLLLASGEKRSDDSKRITGEVILLDVESRQDAAAFMAADPFIAADLFERVVILRWHPVYLGGRALRPRRRLTWQRGLTQS